MRARQSGFTLIELITVIVILGILAAFALPRFAGLESQARTAAIQGLGGAVRSAAALAHALQLATASSGPNDAVIMEGQQVEMANGYPLANDLGITSALQDITGFTSDGAGTFTSDGAPGPCQVQYINNPAPNAPTINVDTAGC